MTGRDAAEVAVLFRAALDNPAYRIQAQTEAA